MITGCRYRKYRCGGYTPYGLPTTTTPVTNGRGTPKPTATLTRVCAAMGAAPKTSAMAAAKSTRCMGHLRRPACMERACQRRECGRNDSSLGDLERKTDSRNEEGVSPGRVSAVHCSAR